MTTIDGIRRSAAGNSVSARARGDGGEAVSSVSRALTVVAPAKRALPPSIGSHRTSAAFLAHLIAVDQQAPQTRERRRADPGQAIGAYRATLGLSFRPRSLLPGKAC